MFRVFQEDVVHHESSSDHSWIYSMMAGMHSLGGSSGGGGGGGGGGLGGLGGLGLLAALGAGGLGIQGNALVQGNNLQVCGSRSFDK